jgi:CO/xanthine dehydrogenase FAD-binding subunit
MLNAFAYRRPADLDRALALFAEHGRKARPLAGGTDLIVEMRAGVSAPEIVVDLKGIASLRALGYDAKGGLSIGGCVTVSELLAYPAVAQHYHLLHVAGSELATHGLRNRATVAGNIVTASPCGDLSGPLLCYEAEVAIVSKRGRRTVPFAKFIEGVKKTVLAPEEIVERIVVPPRMQDGAGGYLKLKRIRGHDLGIITVALLRNDRVLRFAVGSAAPTPILLRDFAASTPVDEIVAEAQARISPIDDVRCTKEYRAHMVGVFVRRLLGEPRAAAKGAA